MIDNLGQDQLSSIVAFWHDYIFWLTGKFKNDDRQHEETPDVDITLMILTMWHLFIWGQPDQYHLTGLGLTDCGWVKVNNW